jgi:hypothetical protein
MIKEEKKQGAWILSLTSLIVLFVFS